MKLTFGSLSLFALVLAPGAAFCQEKVDLFTVHRIKNEALENSKVMEHLFYLTDVHGPRLTNSPGFRAAGEWTVGRLKEIGLSGVKLETWGPFGRGWSYSRFAAHLKEPGYSPMIGFPLAWAPGTEGVLVAEPVHAPIRAEADFEKFKGKLKGKIVLIDAVRETPMATATPGRRLSDADLNERFFAQIGSSRRPPPSPETPGGPSATPLNREALRQFAGKRNQFLKSEGAVAVLSAGLRGDGGTIFASAGGSFEGRYPDPPPYAVITPEHYNRVVRLLEKKIPVKIELEIQAQFHTETKDSFNVVGELPGTSKKDEVVIIGAHFDSWHGGTGATDNAAGSAVMIEAMRVLKAIDAKLDRTVRIALWGGEEQGLLGSKAYVKDHYADPETMALKGPHPKVAGYFNYDNGTGKIRGVYLQGNDMVRPVFEAWMEPFKDLGMNTLSIRNTGGTDHLSFDAVGLPGFQFIQDPIEYDTRTHHSNMDVYDRIQAADLQQASAVIASFAYHAATRAEMLPRKPLPKPQPRRDRREAEQPKPTSNN
ncbi:MAG: M20/M25/M40 family metallo-hydrolase [Acidimicrobiia bacterium]|nr:M20/M25/M40 family metallo-hydrolase [Acidimicrobiia bacterium]